MKAAYWLALFLTPAALAACIPVSGDWILGRDLALADPRLGALPSERMISATPAPGTRRHFTGAEVSRIARANNIPLADPQELCFELPVRPLREDEMISAMLQSLPAGVELTLGERMRGDVPVGDVHFPLTGLGPASAGAELNWQLWHGFVRYTGTRKLEIWARVRVAQRITAVVPSREIPSNLPIEANSLRLESWLGPIQRDRVAVRIEDVAGHVARRALRAGWVIPLILLDLPPVVRRGDAVRVEVLCGPTLLSLEAIAERSGRDGELVELRNPSSGRTFQARLEGAKAVIRVAVGKTL